MSFTRLKNLPQTFSGLGTSFIFVFFCFPIFFVLKPSITEFIIYFVVDSICFFFFRLIADKYFLKKFPSYARIYPDPTKVLGSEAITEEGKLQIYNDLCSFPIERSKLVTFGSYIKAIPTILIVVFYWDHNVSNLTQFFTLFFIMTTTYVYVFGEVYIQSHFYNSVTLRQLHSKFDFSEVFRKVDINEFKHDFEKVERATSLVLLISLLFQVSLVILNSSSDKLELAITVTIICMSTGFLLGYLTNLSRSFIFEGIEDLFNVMNSLNYNTGQKDLALHTASILSKFEQSYNLLINRLRLSEQELSSWISSEAERSRFEALGEMSGLIAHDLSGPLHVLCHCVEELRENPESEKRGIYLKRMHDNLERAVDLVNSLRAKLKDGTKTSSKTNFGICHDHAVRLLRTQFDAYKIDKIKIDVPDSLRNTNLSMKQTDLIQILDNLYRNAFDNLITNEIAQPYYRIDLESETEKEVKLIISDNGTGLRPDQFEQMTSYRFANRENVGAKSLGLKLTRRLIEINGGNLVAINSPIGTKMKLELKKESNHAS